VTGVQTCALPIFLGLNVLREFRVTLDFEREIVRLAPPGG
jgi:hypothetical protein